MPLVLRAKCVLVGDSGVGKSSLTQSFASDGAQFPKRYTMTTGVDVCVKAVQIPNTNASVEFFIYDCGGKDVFYNYVQQFWDSPGVFIIVYDVTNEESFKSSSKWLKRVQAQKFSPDSSLPGVLVANKTDLTSQRVVTADEGKQFGSVNSIDYFECSAKQQEDCEKPFHSLAEQFYKLYETEQDVLKMLT